MTGSVAFISGNTVAFVAIAGLSGSTRSTAITRTVAFTGSATTAVTVLFLAKPARDTGRAMAQENVDVSERALDAGNRHDKAAWLALNDPEVEWVPARDWPESDPIRGREAVWDFWVAVNEPWKERAFEYVEVIEAGDDKLVTHVRTEMQGKASGASVVFSYWLVITFRNGKVLRIEYFAERGEALEAVGLRE